MLQVFDVYNFGSALLMLTYKGVVCREGKLCLRSRMAIRKGFPFLLVTWFYRSKNRFPL